MTNKFIQNIAYKQLKYRKFFAILVNAFLIHIILMISITKIYAIRESRPLSIDSRIRVMVYHPYDVFKFVGYYGYQTSIELSKDEKIISLSLGDTTSWQIVPSGYRIFLKPIEQDATTNMTLITDKRTYFFELYAQEAKNINDPNMVFNIKFLYSDDEEEDGTIRTFASSSSGPDLSEPENLNFLYTISGDEEIAPIKLFDDGEFTYLEFRDQNKLIPAIFAVDDNQNESMVNHHMDQSNKFVVVEQVFKKMSLRYGDKILCIYNNFYKTY